MSDDWRAEMEAADRESAAAADEELKSSIERIKALTSVDHDALRPQVSDSATYDALIKEVAEATRRNESLAQIAERIGRLSNAAVDLAKQVSALIP